jgi:hypothetical protein
MRDVLSERRGRVPGFPMRIFLTHSVDSCCFPCYCSCVWRLFLLRHTAMSSREDAVTKFCLFVFFLKKQNVDQDALVTHVRANAQHVSIWCDEAEVR